MANLLLTTPDYLLRYNVDSREVFIIEAECPEYFGISWFAGTDEIFLSHSGLDNNNLTDVVDYVASEVGWISRGTEKSGPIVSQPHQILCLSDGTVAVTNTGRNCLTIVNTDWYMRHYRFDNVLWDRLTVDDRRGSHINSILEKDDFLYILAHNFDKGSFTLKLERSTFRLVETLKHQASGLHNLWFQDGLLISCDTMRGSLINLSDNRTLWRSHDPGGMTRGLAATRDKIYIGASSIGARSERRSGETGVWILDAARFSTVDYHAIGHFGGIHEVRLLDELDLCHPQGPLALSPYLVGTTPNSFLSARKLAAVAVRATLDERWEIMAGGLTGEADEVRFSADVCGLACLRNSRAACFCVSALLDVSAPRANHCGLIGRYQGPGDTNMVAAILVRDPTTAAATIGLWREDGTGWACLGARPAPRLAINVHLSGEGERATIRIDGANVIVADDLGVPPNGAIGVRGIGGVVRAIQSEILDTP